MSYSEADKKRDMAYDAEADARNEKSKEANRPKKKKGFFEKMFG